MGFGIDGQTKEHALLARSLGVTQLAVAVNKMDTVCMRSVAGGIRINVLSNGLTSQVDWSKQRFDSVQNVVGTFLKQAGFLLKNITWVPCAGLTGENLINRSEPKLAWYSGPTLVQAIGMLGSVVF